MVLPTSPIIYNPMPRLGIQPMQIIFTAISLTIFDLAACYLQTYECMFLVTNMSNLRFLGLSIFLPKPYFTSPQIQMAGFYSLVNLQAFVKPSTHRWQNCTNGIANVTAIGWRTKVFDGQMATQ